MTDIAVNPNGGAGFIASKPFLAENTSRKDSHRQIDLSFLNKSVNEDEDTRDFTDRQRDLTQDIDWEEQICETRELLDRECCDFIKATLTTLLNRDNTAQTSRDRDELRHRAHEAWCKACVIPDELVDCMEREKNAALDRWLCRIDMIRDTYSRAAGSSLNSLVSDFGVRDYALLEVELNGIVGRYKTQGVELRNTALRDAFAASTTALLDYNDRDGARAINLLNSLRGAHDVFKRDHTHDETQVTDDDEITDREIDRDMDQDTTQFAANFQWYQDVSRVAEGSQEYVDDEGAIEGAFDTTTVPGF